ncbi:MAG: hypothetical protein L3J43_01415 [Sulfurovum sp.]|nr:hypothetical protein [Sulfurovum sp.]
MKYKILLAMFAALIYTGCSSKNTPKVDQVIYEQPTPAKEARFHPTMVKVAMSTKDNANYNRMSLDTPEKKTWFKGLMYRLWDRQITRSQFIAEGLSKYPKHRYEFQYIANGFQRF